MKYIHDGTSFLIFSALETMTHSEAAYMASSISSMKHAGFVLFDNKHPKTFGNSVSLKLSSDSFDLGENLYAARNIDRFNFVLVSNNKKWLEALDLEPEIAVWHSSRADDYDEVLDYLDVPHPPIPMRTSQIVGR